MYKNLGQRYKLISDAVNHTKEQLLTIKSHLNKEKSENIYKFFPQNYPSNKQPSDNKSMMLFCLTAPKDKSLGFLST